MTPEFLILGILGASILGAMIEQFCYKIEQSKK